MVEDVVEADILYGFPVGWVELLCELIYFGFVAVVDQNLLEELGEVFYCPFSAVEIKEWLRSSLEGVVILLNVWVV